LGWLVGVRPTALPRLEREKRASEASLGGALLAETTALLPTYSPVQGPSMSTTWQPTKNRSTTEGKIARGALSKFCSEGNAQDKEVETAI